MFLTTLQSLKESITSYLAVGEKKKVNSQLRLGFLVGFCGISFIIRKIKRLQLTNFFIIIKVLY